MPVHVFYISSLKLVEMIVLNLFSDTLWLKIAFLKYSLFERTHIYKYGETKYHMGVLRCTVTYFFRMIPIFEQNVVS